MVAVVAAQIVMYSLLVCACTTNIRSFRAEAARPIGRSRARCADDSHRLGLGLRLGLRFRFRQTLSHLRPAARAGRRCAWIRHRRRKSLQYTSAHSCQRIRPELGDEMAGVLTAALSVSHMLRTYRLML